MSRAVLASLLLFASTSFAADSALLRELMGKSVYEDSGINELSSEQLQVLEKWILENAVETLLIERAPIERKTVNEKTIASAPGETIAEAPALTRAAETPPSAPIVETLKVPKVPPPTRYVKLADVTTEEEEPITQKYVRIDTLAKESQNIMPDLIRSRIDGTFKGWRGKTRFKLENGEIWQQRQSSTYFTTLESPEIIIKKGRMNFYTMEVPAIGRKVHVKRIR